MPLAERPFRLLWLGRVSSAVGDVLVPVALAWAVLELHDSSTALGLVLATFAASRVVFSLAGGVLADRLSRRAVMIACDVVRAAVEIFTAAMLFSHHMTLPLFVATAALFGAASAFFGPASMALVPQTVSAECLQSANALLGMSQNMLNVFGPAVSGAIIVATGTTAWVFAIDAATFVASTLFLLQLRVTEYARAARAPFADELRAGYREVRRRAWVSAALTAFSVSNACLASFLVLGPVVIREGGSAARWGFVAACGAFGGVLGGYLSTKARHSRPLYVAFTSSALIALPIAALAPPLAWEAVGVGFGLGMASIAYANTLWETTLQRRIPSAVLARVRSYDQLVSFVFMPAGYLAFGAIADAAGTEVTLLGAAAVVAATNIAVAATPCIRALRADEPALAPVAAS